MMPTDDLMNQSTCYCRRSMQTQATAVTGRTEDSSMTFASQTLLVLVQMCCSYGFAITNGDGDIRRLRTKLSVGGSQQLLKVANEIEVMAALSAGIVANYEQILLMWNSMLCTLEILNNYKQRGRARS